MGPSSPKSQSTLEQVLSEHLHLNLTDYVVDENRAQVGGGGYSDVFRAQMRSDWKVRSDALIEQLLEETRSMITFTASSQPIRAEVAVKRLRFWNKPSPKIEKEVSKELEIWARLSHPNVLPLLGFVLNWSAYPSFVSPWMHMGTLDRYMRKHSVEILATTREIASGLQYLHSEGIIHADLKCANILLSPTLRPLLTDFGLSLQVIANLSGKSTTSKDISGSLRWMAADFFRSDNPTKKPNKETDVWAFGMTVLELITGEVPYRQIKNDTIGNYQIISSLANCSLPHGPDNLDRSPYTSQELWLLCQECWKREASARPTVTVIQERLTEIENMSSLSPVLAQTLKEFSHLNVARDIIPETLLCVSSGRLSDVFRCEMRRDWQAKSGPFIRSNHRMVAMKCLKCSNARLPGIQQAVAGHLNLLSGLSHPNILPSLGYVYQWTVDFQISFVSPWMEHGSLQSYMQQYDVDVPNMASGIASGLQYLHSLQVVHTDLKCDNVLLSPTLQPLLTGFGFSSQLIADVSTSIIISGGMSRWRAPELLNEGIGKENEKSDMWAFGMTLLELLTKDVPYSGMSDMQVVQSLVDGNIPALLADLTQRPVADQLLWSLCQVCWTIESSKRPNVIEVQSALCRIISLVQEPITQITQIPHLYPHLNLTHVVKPTDYIGLHFIPSSHFTSTLYRESKRNPAFQNLWIGETDCERVADATPNFVKVRARRGWLELTQPEPSIIAKEIATLLELSHTNVLPLLGYLLESDERFSFVFPEVITTLHNHYMHPNGIDILPLTKGIASGLEYLHSNNIVCSTLNSFIIGLSPTWQPLIEVSMLWLSQQDSGIPRKQYQEMIWVYCEWMAVEIFDNRCIGHTTKETDVWAFGMTTLELFTRDYPYGRHTLEADVIENLKHHRLPPPPDDIANHPKAEQELWALVQECWNFEPSERPTAQHLHEKIQGIMKDFPSDPHSQ